MCKISIIVPVYNADQYLTVCINSLLNQTIRDIEILLINDGSTDNSLNIIKEFASKDSRIKYYSITNSGVSTARNLGIEKSRGKWITLVDSDDWVSEDYCEKLLMYTNTNIDLVVGRTISVKDNIPIPDGFNGRECQEFNDSNKINLYKYIINDNPNVRKIPHLATCSAKLFRKTILEKFNILYKTQLKVYEDALFNMQFISKCNKVNVVDSIIYYYRSNEQSVTKKFDINRITDYMNAKKTIEDFFINQNISNYSLDLGVFIVKNIETMAINLNKSNLPFLKKCKLIKKICNNKEYTYLINNIKYSDLNSKKRKLIKLFIRLKLYVFIELLFFLF